MRMEIVFKDGSKDVFDNIASFNVVEEKKALEEEKCVTEVSQIPEKGKLFEVNPLTINRTLFEEPFRNKRKEKTRKIICEALAKVDKYPEKYEKAFYTLIPEKKWDIYKTVGDFMLCAKKFDGKLADWVQQALEWAQRIQNGESWESICSTPDTEKLSRLILWKEGKVAVVGGWSPATYFCVKDANSLFLFTVPLIIKEK